MYRLNFIKILLKISKYINIPIAIPINKNALKTPLLNLNIEYSIIKAVNIQKSISSKVVIKSFVLKDFLSILKTSNNIPIKKPSNMKIINKYVWFSNLSPYLNIFPNKEPPFLSALFSE